MYMNEGIEWLAPMTREWLLGVIREMAQGANGVHLRDLAPRLVKAGVRPVDPCDLKKLIRNAGIPVRDQLKIAGVNAPGIHWAAFDDGPLRERISTAPTYRCVAKIENRKCRIPCPVADPVPLCTYHRWEIAVGVDPDLRNRIPAPPHPHHLVVEARPTPVPSVGKHSPVVYFMALGNRVKIGFTANLGQRLTQMSIPRSSATLTLDGGRDLEAALHQRFAGLRINGSEWFRLEPPLTDYMAAKGAQPLP